MADAQHSGWRTDDVLMHSVANNGGYTDPIIVNSNEVFVATVTPSDWVSSDLEAYITPDNGVTWVPVYSTSSATQKYFAALAASRAHYYSTGLSHIGLRHFKLKAVNDQLQDKTLTLYFVER